MSRVKRGVTKHARHQKVLKAAKGYYGARRKLFGVALQAVEKASAYAYSCLLYTSPSPRDLSTSRMPSSA